MVEYVVDYLGFNEEIWWLGDQDDWEGRPYSKDKYRGEGRKRQAQPFNITLTGHCNMRAEGGWRLHTMIPCVDDRSVSGGYAVFWGVLAVFERPLSQAETHNATPNVLRASRRGRRRISRPIDRA